MRGRRRWCLRRTGPHGRQGAPGPGRGSPAPAAKAKREAARALPWDPNHWTLVSVFARGGLCAGSRGSMPRGRGRRCPGPAPRLPRALAWGGLGSVGAQGARRAGPWTDAHPGVHRRHGAGRVGGARAAEPGAGGAGGVVFGEASKWHPGGALTFGSVGKAGEGRGGEGQCCGKQGRGGRSPWALRDREPSSKSRCLLSWTGAPPRPLTCLRPRPPPVTAGAPLGLGRRLGSSDPCVRANVSSTVFTENRFPARVAVLFKRDSPLQVQVSDCSAALFGAVPVLCA